MTTRAGGAAAGRGAGAGGRLDRRSRRRRRGPAAGAAATSAGASALAAFAGLGRLLGLLGLDVADEALALRLATDAVGLRLLDARGVRLDADPQRLAEVQRLLVGEAELLGELVHALLACQVSWSSPSLFGTYCVLQLLCPCPAVHPRTIPRDGTIRTGDQRWPAALG